MTITPQNLAKAEELCNNVYHKKDADNDGLCNFWGGYDNARSALQQRIDEWLKAGGE